MVDESPGRNTSERRGGPESAGPGGRARNRRAKAARTAAARLTRRLAPAGWERRHGDPGTSSHWRSPPRPAAKAAEPGRPYHRPPREVGRRREGGGGARRSGEAGERPRGEGALLVADPSPAREAGGG